jgi:hypothetical protein
MAQWRDGVEAAGGSGRGSGEGERGGGDQSEGYLAKHTVLQFDGREAVVSSLPLRPRDFGVRSPGKWRILFREGFVRSGADEQLR